MKKIKHLALSLISATLVTASLFSCSSEDNTSSNNLEQTEKNTNVASRSGSIYNLFQEKLEDKYTSFEFGRETTLVDEDNLNFKLVEAIINDNTKAYFLYNIDLNTEISLLEYKLNEKIIITDYINNETYEINELSTIPNFELNGFDLIDLANYNQTTGIIIGGGKRFWGWTCGPKYYLEPGSCYQTCQHSVFWSETKIDVRGCYKNDKAHFDRTMGIGAGGTEIN